MIAVMLEAEVPANEGQTFAQILRNPRLYALMAVYFSFAAAISVLQFWLPTIIRSLGVTDVALINLPIGSGWSRFLARSRNDCYRRRLTSYVLRSLPRGRHLLPPFGLEHANGIGPGHAQWRRRTIRLD